MNEWPIPSPLCVEEGSMTLNVMYVWIGMYVMSSCLPACLPACLTACLPA